MFFTDTNASELIIALPVKLYVLSAKRAFTYKFIRKLFVRKIHAFSPRM